MHINVFTGRYLALKVSDPEDALEQSRPEDRRAVHAGADEPVAHAPTSR